MILAVFCSSCSDVEATYTFPDVCTGFVASSDRVSVAMAVEMFDKRICSDAIVAENLLAVGLGWRMTSLYEIKLEVYYGWDFLKEEYEYGGALLILQF